MKNPILIKMKNFFATIIAFFSRKKRNDAETFLAVLQGIRSLDIAVTSLKVGDIEVKCNDVAQMMKTFEKEQSANSNSFPKNFHQAYGINSGREKIL